MALSTNAELLDQALFVAGETTSGNSDYETQALTWYIEAYRKLWMGGNEWVKDENPNWWWLKTDANLILNPVIDPSNTGPASVAVTNNSAAITFSASITPTMVGRFVKIGSHKDVFQILTHTSGTAAMTLDSVYTGLTSTAAADYRIMQLEYDFQTDILAFVGPLKMQSDPYEIHLTSMEDMDRKFPLTLVQSGTPAWFAPVDEDTFRFSHYGGLLSTDFIRVDYEYLQRPSDPADDALELPIPLQFRTILSDMVAVKIFFDKEEQRTGDLAAATKANIESMIAWNRSKWNRASGRRAHIYPRSDQKHMNTTGPLRTASGLIIG